ncbi:hypothetical protein FB566_3088 [Stackebrandtia endophytica]|uniref:Uncharacterized protein n=1 Tax=Stackebrandtia endophytica TaxID=1496996 RepID=A0A543AY73_9ACTN|nr:hypothetical protein [Stackebrandtia endophytica]TQL77529.1 hypothetical protein FB566_3088 [Stackebrandtia endophytica]
MTIKPCDFQILSPTNEPLPVAPEHPDPVIAAQFATVARSARPRRFALCQAIPARPDTDEVVVRPMYQGLRNPDGSCVLLMAGQPYGYYQSVDAAYRHAEGTDLYLVWLEPEPTLPDATETSANVEARENEPEMWLVAMPFLSHGPNDARLRAIEIAEYCEPSTPGLHRQSALLLSGDDPTRPITVFCPIAPCMREPFHHGDHEPAPIDPDGGEA